MHRELVHCLNEEPTRFGRLIFGNRLGAHTFLVFKFSVTILRTLPLSIFNISAIALIVRRRSCLMILLKLSMFSFVKYVIGR